MFERFKCQTKQKWLFETNFSLLPHGPINESALKQAKLERFGLSFGINNGFNSNRTI